MVEIKLHGGLAQKFGEDFKLDLSDPKYIVHALDVNNKGFKKEVMKMHKQGFHYALIIDDKDISDCTEEDLSNCKKIDIVPIIVGSFWFVFVALAAALGSAAVIAAGWGIVATTLALIAISVAAAVLMAALAPDGPDPVLASSESRALEQSFKFSNKTNVTNQGVALPLGYGRMMIGSSVVGFRELSHQSNLPVRQAFEQSGGGAGQVANPSWP
jgi:predicted phage tail protein